MCCIFYCLTEKVVKLILAIVSALTVILGIVAIIVGLNLTGKLSFLDVETIDEMGNPQTFSIGKLFFTIVIILAVIAILTAVLGFLACKWPNKCTICLNAFFSFVVSTGFLLSGFILVYINGVAKEVIDQYCNVDAFSASLAGLDDIFDKLNGPLEDYYPYMCTENILSGV